MEKWLEETGQLIAGASKFIIQFIITAIIFGTFAMCAGGM